jgi:hypothetical protein
MRFSGSWALTVRAKVARRRRRSFFIGMMGNDGRDGSNESNESDESDESDEKLLRDRGYRSLRSYTF